MLEKKMVNSLTAIALFMQEMPTTQQDTQSSPEPSALGECNVTICPNPVAEPQGMTVKHHKKSPLGDATIVVGGIRKKCFRTRCLVRGGSNMSIWAAVISHQI